MILMNSFMRGSNRKLFFFQLMGCLIFLIQFILLEAYTGALGLAVNILRNLLLLKVNDWPWVRSKKTLAAILVLLTELGLFTFMTLYITYSVPEKDFSARRA